MTEILTSPRHKLKMLTDHDMSCCGRPTDYLIQRLSLLCYCDTEKLIVLTFNEYCYSGPGISWKSLFCPVSLTESLTAGISDCSSIPSVVTCALHCKVSLINCIGVGLGLGGGSWSDRAD